MAISNAAIFPQKVQSWAVQILPADTTTLKTLVTAGSNGSIIESLMVTNTDSTVAYTYQVFANDGATSHLLGSANIPVSAGNVPATNAAVDILRSGNLPGLPVDANGNFVIYLPSGWTLKVAVTVTVTAAKVIDSTAMGADY
jgi:hypothetical protein